MFIASVCGNLGKKPHKIFEGKFGAVYGLSICCNQYIYNRETRASENKPMWFSARVKGEKAQAILPYVDKGSRVCIHVKSISEQKFQDRVTLDLGDVVDIYLVGKGDSNGQQDTGTGQAYNEQFSKGHNGSEGGFTEGGRFSY